MLTREGEEFEAVSVDEALANLIKKFDGIIEDGESALNGEQSKGPSTDGKSEKVTDVLPGFSERVSGEIIFCDADNVNTDAIYPGKFTYQNDVTRSKWRRSASCCPMRKKLSHRVTWKTAGG